MFKDIFAGFLLLWLCLGFSNCSHLEMAVRMDKLREMRNNMNESVDPCENFHEFVCGGWPQHHTGEEFDKFDFNRQIDLIVMSDKDEKDTKVARALKDYYKACVGLPNTPEHYSSKLKDLIAEFGQMPALAGGNWNESAFDWQQIVGNIDRKYGISIIVRLALSSGTHIVLDWAGFVLPADRSTHFDGDIEEIRSTWMSKVVPNLMKFLDLDSETAGNVSKEMFDFERALAYGVISYTTAPDITSTTIEEIEGKYSPILNGKKLIETVYGYVPPLNLYEDQRYLQNVAEVLKKTPKRVVANYIFYKLTSEFFFERQNDEETQRNFCLKEVKRGFPTDLEGLLYHSWYSTQQTKTDLDEMWQKIKEAFEDVLKSPRLSWMAENTRTYALEKLHAMRLVVPALEESILDEVEINEHSYIANIAGLGCYITKKHRNRLNVWSSVRQVGLDNSPVNILNKNIISVPVSALQPNYLMDHAMPAAFTFGKLGSLLAHALVHGFDDYGRKYDKTGKELDWWDEQSVQKFNEGEQCFMDQYNKFTFAGQHLDTYYWQVADNGGVHLAYLAYLKWYQDSSRTPQELAWETFSRLSYTNKQLFFIGYGQYWCPKPEYNNYAPHGEYIQLTLSNLEEFSEDFSCPRGSAMNPNQNRKCQIY